MLGRLLVGIRLGFPEGELEALADVIMKAGGDALDPVSVAFFWENSVFDQLNQKWRRVVDRLLQPTNESFKRLRENLLAV